ncbi:MAG: amidophosphoribosyltransferase [Eubacteriales bacterium]|nr:amidophosphoribosyltransferase [Eubacteriales bacterium]
MKEECGIIGVHRHELATDLVYLGLHSLQHRGQEACGISASAGRSITTVKGSGLVDDVFQSTEDLEKLKPAFQSLGHVRYATSGENILENTQPLMVRSHQGDFCVAHNGQIVNAPELRYELELKGSIFQGTTDSEVICHLIQRAKGSMLEKISAACQQLVGAFSLAIMTKNTMYAVRDKNGLRPLCLGRMDESWVISSESCALNLIGSKLLRDVAPGEIIKLGKQGFESHFYVEAAERRKKLCAMEYVYFARPDSRLDEHNVHQVRRQTGFVLGQRDEVEADIVIGVPDSSLSAASGYAEARGLPYEMGLVKNRYIGRTFINPGQELRAANVKIKLSAITDIVRGKRIILVDDSIVRGTTAKRIVELMREAGAREIHLRIVAPPLVAPCFYGIDLKNKQQLLAANLNAKELVKFFGCDSLEFLSLEELFSCCGDGVCTACFNEDYPTPLFSHEAAVNGACAGLDD